MCKKIDIDEILNEYLGESSREKIELEADLSEKSIQELIESMSEELKVIDLTKVEPKLRLLHPFERETLSHEAREYLSELLRTFVIDGMTFEHIINRFYGQLDVEKEDIDRILKELKIDKNILMN